MSGVGSGPGAWRGWGEEQRQAEAEQLGHAGRARGSGRSGVTAHVDTWNTRQVTRQTWYTWTWTILSRSSWYIGHVWSWHVWWTSYLWIHRSEVTSGQKEQNCLMIQHIFNTLKTCRHDLNMWTIWKTPWTVHQGQDFHHSFTRHEETTKYWHWQSNYWNTEISQPLNIFKYSDLLLLQRIFFLHHCFYFCRPLW